MRWRHRRDPGSALVRPSRLSRCWNQFSFPVALIREQTESARANPEALLSNSYAGIMPKFRDLRLAFVVLCLPAAYAAGTGNSPCMPEVAGVRFTCPVGWSILNQDHAHPGEITIGDFSPNPDEKMKNVIPAGKNTIIIMPKPILYATTDDWISATEHMASGAKETTEVFANESGSQVSARCFTLDPGPRKPGYYACIFVIDGKALMLDLFVSPKATNIAGLRGYLRDMIKTAKP